MCISMINHSHTLDENVIRVLKAYVTGTEHNDIEPLKLAFHNNFRVVALTVEGLRVIERDAYLSLINTHKIGGHKRTLMVNEVIDSGNILQLSVTLSGEQTVFHDHLDLIKQDAQWKILHNTTRIESISET